ncbi:(Fe-S)-binding protein [bacterium]|nr:(Fe-S)-binding protein [bacterium]
MAKLKDYTKEISKCSKCGLCQTVCPVFQKTLNECDGARGKMVMLEGVLNGAIKIDDKMLFYFKKCDGCNFCESACPAGIKIKEIFNCVIENL